MSSAALFAVAVIVALIAIVALLAFVVRVLNSEMDEAERFFQELNNGTLDGSTEDHNR